MKRSPEKDTKNKIQPIKSRLEKNLKKDEDNQFEVLFRWFLDHGFYDLANEIAFITGKNTLKILMDKCDQYDLYEDLNKELRPPNWASGTLFQWACARGHKGIVSQLAKLWMLLKSESEIQAILLRNFYRICMKNQTEMAELFVELGIRLNKNHRLFHIASKYDSVDIAKWLIHKGMNIKEDILSIVNVACAYNRVKFLEWLFSDLSRVEEVNFSAMLQLCTKYKSNDCFKWICNTFNIDRSDLEKCFIGACESGSLGIAMFLYKFGIDIHRNDDEALIVACEYGNIKIVDWLIYAGANKDVLTFDLFVKACMDGNENMSNIIYYVNQIHFDDRMMNDVASTFCIDGNLEAAKILKNSSGIHVFYGKKCITNACLSKSLEIVIWLVKEGINIHTDKWGLMEACTQVRAFHILNWLKEYYTANPKHVYNRKNREMKIHSCCNTTKKIKFSERSHK